MKYEINNKNHKSKNMNYYFHEHLHIDECVCLDSAIAGENRK